MQTPTVSFVIPCYNLAHLLKECVDSILSQTFTDFEVLIMDDCSPDHTARVARSFKDPRVKYIRNEVNLRHLRNYNKGISLSRGKYVWMISADDYLRRPYILHRYVELMESHPNVGYVFCSGVGVRDGRETGVLDYSVQGTSDRLIKGHDFLKVLSKGNPVLVVSVMARRECYEQISYYPEDMPWSGDWYLWCVFALHHDVGYFAEPMVCYREHSVSMTNQLQHATPEVHLKEDASMPFRVKRRADEAGFGKISQQCVRASANWFVRMMTGGAHRMSRTCMSEQDFEKLLSENSADETEREWIRAMVYAGLGDQFYWQNDMEAARRWYSAALAKAPWMTMVRVKRTLLSLGSVGNLLRTARWLGRVKREATQAGYSVEAV